MHDASARGREAGTSARVLLLACALFAAVAAVTAWRFQPPSLPDEEAPADQFDVRRVKDVLRQIDAAGPHPTGSPAAAQVRQLVVSELKKRGREPNIQISFVCGESVCSEVQDVITTFPGWSSGEAPVVLNAHYDSVWAGPGVGDDGSGVAIVLEIARVLAQSPPARRPVILLVNEGEEDDLLGATAFVNHDPLSRGGTFINLEARGTEGLSLMFETGPHNRPIVSAFANSSTRPATSSLFQELLPYLPNDTDFSVFKKVGTGAGFAFIGGAARYHTPLDRLASLDLASVQHQGANALGMVRALSNVPQGSDDTADVAYFDLFGLTVVSIAWSVLRVASLAALAALAFAAWRSAKRARVTWRAVAMGFARSFGVLALAIVCSVALYATLRWFGAYPQDWITQPGWDLAAFVLLGVLVVELLRKATAHESVSALFGAFLAWGALGVVTAFVAPGGSYLFVLPACAAAIAAWIPSRDGALARPSLVLLPLAVAAVVWCPILVIAYQGMGTLGFCLVATVTAVVWGCAVPFPTVARARRFVLVAGAVALVLLSLGAEITPASGAEDPAAFNWQWQVDGDTGAARLVSYDEPAPPWLPKQGAVLQAALAVPWQRASGGFSIVVARPTPPPPVLERGPSERTATGWHGHAFLSSSRAAAAGGFALPTARLRSVRVNGVSVHVQPRRSYSRFRIATLGQRRVELEWDVSGTEPVELFYWDLSMGVPASEWSLARDQRAVPSNYGDGTIVWRRAVLSN